MDETFSLKCFANFRIGDKAIKLHHFIFHKIHYTIYTENLFFIDWFNYICIYKSRVVVFILDHVM